MRKSDSSLHDMIGKFIEFFTKITKEESDNIEDILRWSDESRAAFFLAKRIFEEDMCKDCEVKKPDFPPKII